MIKVLNPERYLIMLNTLKNELLISHEHTKTQTKNAKSLLEIKNESWNDWLG